MSESPRPTDVELQILNVFWELGPSTVRQVHNQISEGVRKGTSYSTTLKMIQVLHTKGLLTRDESVRPQIYQTTVSREATQRSLLQHLTNKLFSGAVTDLVQCAISSGKPSDAELREMQTLIESAKSHDRKTQTGRRRSERKRGPS